MRGRAENSDASPLRRGARELGQYGLIVGAVVLAWQIGVQPLAQRAPAEIAVRVAPGSPLVLRRAAESELAAGRVQNAAALSRDALVRSPFDVRALRVFGLTEARAGREAEADDVLTLAGNWSLRDDPAHAWLVERRLRRGDYTSAFAHADTLVRRRQDIQPQVFRLFTVAGTEDPQRSLPVIARLLAARPPWRAAYMGSLSGTTGELQLAVRLAIMLEASRAPLTNDELQFLYQQLLGNRMLEALATVREQVGRPAPGLAVTNGGFSAGEAPEPFQWRLLQKAGIAAEITSDDIRPSNRALRVDYDGYATGVIAEQLVLLTPGSYRFAAEVRTEAGDAAARLAWTLSCAAGGQPIALLPAGGVGVPSETWTTLSGQVEIPSGCPAQWLRLETRAADRRSATVVWYDRASITPVG